MNRRRLVATFGVGVVGAVLAAMASPALASTTLEAPRGFTVTRAVDDVFKVRMSWKPVLGVHHYAVEVISGETQRITAIPAGTTTFTLPAGDACISYKMRVGSVDTAGMVTNTGYTSVRSLAPGAVMGMKTAREENGTIGTTSWRAPVWPGFTPLTGYHTELTRLIDGAVLLDEVSTATDNRFPRLDPTRAYVLRVSAYNAYGTCLTAKSLMDRYRPADVAALTATRRDNTPERVDVVWQAPKDGPAVTYYQVSYGGDKPSTTLRVSLPAISTTLNLDPAKNWVVTVKAYNENGGSAGITVPVAATPGEASPTEPPAAKDMAPPTITATTSTPPSANGWHTRPVTVMFACADAESGIAGCPKDVQVSDNGANQAVTGTATDKAGNKATATARVSIDQTVPTITAAVIGEENASGWYRAAPIVQFTCSDTFSLVASCPVAVKVRDSGADQVVTGTAYDNAGNTTTATVTDLDIDLVAPQVKLLGAINAKTYTLDAMPVISCDTTDAISGVAHRADPAVRRQLAGTHTATCANGSDNAGNAADTTTVTFTVKPTVSSLSALTDRYLIAAGASNGISKDLTSKLAHGQFGQYITKVLSLSEGNRPVLSRTTAAELTYWAGILNGQS
jgi:hypothetical protein